MAFNRLEEFQTKLDQVRQLFDPEEVDAILISDQLGFAWITCGGDNHISLMGPAGSASVLVTADSAYLICNNAEELRITEEEIAGLPLEVVTFNWHEATDREILQDLLGGQSLGVDVPRKGAKDISAPLTRLRYTLLPPEVDRLHWVGREAEAALRQVCLEAEVGESEFELAGRIAQACYSRKMLPITTLVAVDERISRIRHPIPSDRELKQTALLVLCARRWGLYASLTRLIHFGTIEEDLRKRHQVVTRIDATMIVSSRIGTSYKEVFNQAVERYKKEGYPDDWQGLHLGGATGYSGRYFKASPLCEEIIQDSQAIAWNPAIDGTKSEDTIIVSENEISIVTEARDWPKIEHRIDDIVIARPDILIR